jgi:hypothetical protein
MEIVMKLATLALIAVTVAIPAAALADSSQPNSSPNAAAPAGQMQKNSGKAMKNGAKAEDSSIPGASIHESKQDAKMKKNGSMTTGSKAGMNRSQEGAADSSIPGASKH